MSESSFTPGFTVVLPLVCPDCGKNAQCIRRTPDKTGKPYEFRIFECIGCDYRVVQIANANASEAEVQAQADRMSGISKDAR